MASNPLFPLGTPVFPYLFDLIYCLALSTLLTSNWYTKRSQMSTQKRGKIYYSRLRVPSSLQLILQKKEVVRSLRTSSYSVALVYCWINLLICLGGIVIRSLFNTDQSLATRPFNMQDRVIGSAWEDVLRDFTTSFLWSIWRSSDGTYRRE